MAAELDKLAQMYTERGNKPRAALYKALALEERAIGGPETVIPVTSPIVEQPAKEVLAPYGEMPVNVYVIKPVEEFRAPSVDQLVTTSKTELKSHFGIDVEVPTPPAELFQTLEAFAERGISNFDEVFYLPGIRLDKGHKFFKGRDKVKPEDYFWDQLKNGNYPAENAELEAGWFIGDKRGKPQYDNGQQMYEDDYLAPLMEALRSAGKVERYGNVPAGSRFGVSPREIEEVVLPTFKGMSGAEGVVRNRRYMEFNVRGNMAHQEWGKTNTWEWFADPAYKAARRLVGGFSDVGGLAYVNSIHVDYRHDIAAFSPVVVFPSKA